MRKMFKTKRGAHKNLRAFNRNENRREARYADINAVTSDWNAMSESARRAKLEIGGAKERTRAVTGKLGPRPLLKFRPREYQNGQGKFATVASEGWSL